MGFQFAEKLFFILILLSVVVFGNNCSKFSPANSASRANLSSSDDPAPPPPVLVPPTTLPNDDPGIGGPGIASKYTGDAGIAGDPDVVFTENFESATVSEMLTHWDDYKTAFLPNMELVTNDVPPGSSGKKSFRSNGSTDMFKLIQPTDGKPGFERLFFRFYAKITSDPKCELIHHWPFMGGYDPPLKYPLPRAGEVPNDDDVKGLNTAGRFSSAVETSANQWSWDFYTYWPEMRPGGDGKYYGNSFNTIGGYNTKTPFPVQRGEWVAVEFMIKLNEFGKENGEQAFWINGELKSFIGAPPDPQIRGEFAFGYGNFVQSPNGPIFPGLKWRTTRPNLMINYIWLENFVDLDPDCIVSFDDVVVAKKYIGPLKR
jgi:hypothetical protein